MEQRQSCLPSCELLALSGIMILVVTSLTTTTSRIQSEKEVHVSPSHEIMRLMMMKQMIMMMTTTESHDDDDDGRRKRGWRTEREGCALYSFPVLCMIPGKMILLQEEEKPSLSFLSFSVFFSPSSCSSWCLMQEERWGKKWRRGSSSNREKKEETDGSFLSFIIESWLETGLEHHQDKCLRISDDGDGKRRRTREEERRGGRIERVQSREEHLWQGVVRSLSLDHSFPEENTHSSLPSSSSFSFPIPFDSLPVYILWIFHVMRKRKRSKEKNRKSSLESEKRNETGCFIRRLTKLRVFHPHHSLPPLLPLFFFHCSFRETSPRIYLLPSLSHRHHHPWGWHREWEKRYQRFRRHKERKLLRQRRVNRGTMMREEGEEPRTSSSWRRPTDEKRHKNRMKRQWMYRHRQKQRKLLLQWKVITIISLSLSFTRLFTGKIRVRWEEGRRRRWWRRSLMQDIPSMTITPKRRRGNRNERNREERDEMQRKETRSFLSLFWLYPQLPPQIIWTASGETSRRDEWERQREWGKKVSGEEQEKNREEEEVTPGGNLLSLFFFYTKRGFFSFSFFLSSLQQQRWSSSSLQVYLFFSVLLLLLMKSPSPSRSSLFPFSCLVLLPSLLLFLLSSSSSSLYDHDMIKGGKKRA